MKKVETLEEFKARGGVVKVIKPPLPPDKLSIGDMGFQMMRNGFRTTFLTRRSSPQ